MELNLEHVLDDAIPCSNGCRIPWANIVIVARDEHGAITQCLCPDCFVKLCKTRDIEEYKGWGNILAILGHIGALEHLK